MLMWNEPTDQDLKKMPRLYATENTPAEDTMIYEHFFLGGCDWYVAEYDPDERVFFGYAILNDDLDNAQWGSISVDRLRQVRTRQGIEVDRDPHSDERLLWLGRLYSEGPPA